MRRLPIPVVDEAEVYNACADDVPEGKIPVAYSGSSEAMMLQAAEYRVNAAGYSLHSLPASNWGDDDQVVVGALRKGDLKRLYDVGMLKGVNARKHYDKLIASAPLGKCPYCRFGHAETLDHFLSKSRYPSFAVLPSNLVPACMRCNKGKGGGVVTSGAEMSHPYFEVPQIEQDVWLFAEIVETSPVTAKYFFTIPAHWPADLAGRVNNYFTEFELPVRYAIEAASELVSVSAYLRALPSSRLRYAHLHRVAGEERGISRNGWKTALYAALAGSSWYSDVGYAGLGVT